MTYNELDRKIEAFMKEHGTIPTTLNSSYKTMCDFKVGHLVSYVSDGCAVVTAFGSVMLKLDIDAKEPYLS